jgi:hypothetical protein
MFPKLINVSPIAVRFPPIDVLKDVCLVISMRFCAVLGALGAATSACFGATYSTASSTVASSRSETTTAVA